MLKHALPALAAALLLTACESMPTIKVDADPTADFGHYSTYSWAYRAAPQGMSPLVFDRVKQSIDATLAARGYRQADPGDFAVGFTLGKRDKVQVDDLGAYGPYYGWRGWAAYSNVNVTQYTEGSLTIDIYDTATKHPVWHGVATQNLGSAPVDQAAIDSVVSQVLAKFNPLPPLAK